MVNIKEIYETIFIELTEDKKLLDLLNVPYENLEGNDLLVAFRKQILENSIPDDLLKHIRKIYMRHIHCMQHLMNLNLCCVTLRRQMQ